MSDQQVKEFFATVLEGGPADRLDLDHAVAAGRRRRRVRTANTLASAAAVLVVVGALVVSVLPDDGRKTVLIGTPTSSPTLSDPTSTGADTIIGGSADDWARALEPYLPAGTETPAVRAIAFTTLAIPGHVGNKATFRIVRDGRATALVISASSTASIARTESEALAEVRTACRPTEVVCDPVLQMASGPVLVFRWTDRSHVGASSIRANGVVVRVDSYNADVGSQQLLDGSRQLLDGSGDAPFADDIDPLVTLAASVPLPAAVVPAPSTGAPTVESSTGLRGVPSDGVCPTTASEDQPAALPIAGEPLTLRICPPLGWPESFGTRPVDLSTADGFTRLLDLLGRPDEPFAPPTPSPDPTIPYACPAMAQARPTVFVVTSTGTYRLALPSYDMTPDGCTFIQEDVLSALMDALRAG
jgi:hypothetical protein